MKTLTYIFLLFSTSLLAQHIELVSHLPLNGSIGFDVWGYNDTVNDRQYALMGQDHYIKIIDVTDPENPDSVSSVTMLSDTMFAFDQKVFGNYLYVVDGYSEDGERAVIYDISDIGNPVFVDTLPTAHNIFIDDQGYLFASCKGLKIYDIHTDPENPTLVWTNNQNGLDCHDVLVMEDRLFDFEGFKNWKVTEYDISDRSNPIKVDSILDWDIRYAHSGALAQDSILFVCDELDEFQQDDITIWNMNAEPKNLKIGGYNDPDATVHNIYAIDTLLFVSYYKAGFRVFDISDPANMVLLDEFLTDTLLPSDPNTAGAFGCYPYGKDGLIYVSDRSNGLFVFRLTESAVGLQEMEESTLKVYPVPFSEKVTVELPDPSFKEIILRNPAGQILNSWLTDGSTNLTLSFFDLQLPSGIYFLHSTGKERTLRTKCIYHLTD